MSTAAREALAHHRQQLTELAAKTFALECAAREEETAERARLTRVDWEREVAIGPRDWGGEITAAATWPRGDVLPKWLIGVGCQGRLLAVYEVTNYKGGRIASLLHYFRGEPPPVEVELEVFRHWSLKRSG